MTKRSKCVFSVREQMEFVGGYTILMVHAATPWTWIVTANNGSVRFYLQGNQTHTHATTIFCFLHARDGWNGYYSYMNGSIYIWSRTWHALGTHGMASFMD